MKQLFLISTLLLTWVSTAFSQAIFGVEYKHRILTYPQNFNSEGKRTYNVTVEMENGAEQHWNMNINGVVKNFLTLEGLSLSENDPAFKITVKIYRKTETATPIQYGITDNKGNVLLLVSKNDSRFNYAPGISLDYQMNKLLERMNYDIQKSIDFSAEVPALSSYNYKKDKPEFADFVNIQDGVNHDFYLQTLAPGRTCTLPAVKKAEEFWKFRYASVPPADKKFKNTKLLTAYNLASIYALDGNIDSAVKWSALARQEARYDSYIDKLDTLIKRQKENVKNFNALKAVFGSFQLDFTVKKKNIEIATSRSFAPKEGEGFREQAANLIYGAIYKNGKRTDGVFTPLPNKPFDPGFVRFTAQGEKAIKLITPLFADSIIAGEKRFAPAGDKFGTILVENAKLRITEYAPLTSTEQDFGPIFYVLNKATKQTSVYRAGTIKISKFLAKFFANCAEMQAKIEQGAYDLSSRKALLNASEDFLKACN